MYKNKGINYFNYLVSIFIKLSGYISQIEISEVLKMPATDDGIDVDALYAKITKRTVVLNILMGVVTYLYYHYVPSEALNFNSTADRLAYVLQCNVLSVWLILILIGYVIFIRVNSHQIDPLSKKDLQKIEVPSRVLQNTLEQFVINIFLQLTSATWFGNNHLKLIPACAFWFFVGRILFWIGYNNPSEYRTNRGFGFAITVIPTMALAIFCLSMFLRHTLLTFFSFV